VNIHLTDGEFAEVASRAAAQGKTPGEYGRGRLLAGKAEPLPSRAEAEATHTNRLVQIQLRRLGNLLNQLVRHLHQTGEVLPEAAPLLRDIRSILSGRGEP
jgi:hypothetical protein